MHNHRGQGGGWVGAGRRPGGGRGGGWEGVGRGPDVRIPLQLFVGPLLHRELCGLDWNFIQMSVERPRNGSGVDSASTDGARVSTTASFRTSQRSSVPSKRQGSGGIFLLFGVLPLSGRARPSP